MRRFISGALAAALMITMLAGCTGSESSVVESSQSESAGTTAENVENTPAEGTGSWVTNPVKVTAEGDVDMEAALSYQTDIEALVAALNAKTVDPSKPVSENTSDFAMETFNYLYEGYGKRIISAQQQMGNQTYEDLVYYDSTGDLPAMKGFDFIFSTGKNPDNYMIDEAIEWHKTSGGLVTFTWHWNVPRDIDNLDKGIAFYQKEILNWSPLNAVTPGTKEYEQIIHDIDYIAIQLQRMEKEGMTILFRPLHEASGSWFWWGVQDKQYVLDEIFQKLWYIIFDRIENYHKLTNIIWVWNGQSKYCQVSPNSYDIAGVDYYANSEDHSACEQKYSQLKGLNQGSEKMLALSECGYIPDPQACKDADSMWLYYMIWNGDFVYETYGEGGGIKVSLDGTPSPNPERMTKEMLQEYFANEYFVSWSDLPTKGDTPTAIKTWEYFRIKPTE